MIQDIANRFDDWMNEQTKWKQFLALFGVFSVLFLLVAVAIVGVVAMFVLTVKLMVTVSPWFTFLLVAEAIAIFAGFAAWVIVND